MKTAMITMRVCSNGELETLYNLQAGKYRLYEIDFKLSDSPLDIANKIIPYLPEGAHCMVSHRVKGKFIFSWERKPLFLTD
ncbi:MAG: hypothetical protein KDJ38_08125 [Gammaproteobacteria bacterium]|nr:hypothetical protein [Gammaproteobacteria bacterium]